MGGSEQRWRKTQIVARTSGHPSRCRWTAGKRASSRDARDILVSELQPVGSIVCRSQGRLGGNERSDWKSAGGELQIVLDGRSTPELWNERVCAPSVDGAVE